MTASSFDKQRMLAGMGSWLALERENSEKFNDSTTSRSNYARAFYALQFKLGNGNNFAGDLAVSHAKQRFGINCTQLEQLLVNIDSDEAMGKFTYFSLMRLAHALELRNNLVTYTGGNGITIPKSLNLTLSSYTLWTLIRIDQIHDCLSDVISIRDQLNAQQIFRGMSGATPSLVEKTYEDIAEELGSVQPSVSFMIGAARNNLASSISLAGCAIIFSAIHRGGELGAVPVLEPRCPDEDIKIMYPFAA